MPCPILPVAFSGDLGRIADRVRDRQLVALRIEQVDGKRLELRDARDELGDLLEQLVEVEHGRDFPSEREERRQRLKRAGANVGFGCSGGFGHGEERV